jgi:cyclopropane fatty-acyl-phospholipid synthase-like methyltransferase
MHGVASEAAKLVHVHSGGKILDIAASHGLFGIAVAKQNPGAKIVALDFPSALAVAKENAERFGVSDRHTFACRECTGGSVWNRLRRSGGDESSASLGPRDNPVLLKKVYAALSPGGQIVVVEFAPNDDSGFTTDTSFLRHEHAGEHPWGQRLHGLRKPGDAPRCGIRCVRNSPSHSHAANSDCRI